MQLDQFAKEGIADVAFVHGPLDWLLCPPENLARWLDEGMPVFERGEISEWRGRAWWNRFDICFWHRFFVKKRPWWRSIGNRLKPPFHKVRTQPYLDIEKTFDRELSKLIYQREKFLALDPLKTLFFISNTQKSLDGTIYTTGEEHLYHFTETSLHTLHDSLSRFYGVSVKLHCVTRSDRATPGLLTQDSTSVIDSDQSENIGDSIAWNRIIRKCLHG